MTFADWRWPASSCSFSWIKKITKFEWSTPPGLIKVVSYKEIHENCPFKRFEKNRLWIPNAPSLKKKLGGSISHKFKGFHLGVWGSQTRFSPRRLLQTRFTHEFFILFFNAIPAIGPTFDVPTCFTSWDVEKSGAKRTPERIELEKFSYAFICLTLTLQVQKSKYNQKRLSVRLAKSKPIKFYTEFNDSTKFPFRIPMICKMFIKSFLFCEKKWSFCRFKCPAW